MAKVAGIEWDADNRADFAERGRCRPHEVEDVLRARCHPSRSRLEPGPAGQEPRRRGEGQACNDRTLVVIAAVLVENILRPITCWPLSGDNLESYRGWRRTIRR